MGDFCVRLVKKVPEVSANKRVTIEKMRRQSVFANVDMLRRFTTDGFRQGVEPTEAKLEVIHTWHFPKFCARLQLMQDVHEAWARDPENFFLDPYNDPWSEYGLGDIAQLQQEQNERLAQSHDQLQRMREESLGLRDSHLAHNLLTRMNNGDMADHQSPSSSAAMATAELLNLRENHRQLELANA